MTGTETLLVFRLDDQRYALELAAVDRVISAIAITSLPQAPEIVMGIINVAGQILPVFNLRRRFGLTERRMTPSDQLILARTGRRTVVLSIDTADGLINRPPGESIAPAQIMTGLAHLKGVLRVDDGLVLIQDLAQFLSLDEERALEAALEHQLPRVSLT